MNAERASWDAQSERDFGNAELDLFNLVNKLDDQWIHVSDGCGLLPQDAIAQLERIKATVNFMLQAAKWAR